MPSLVDHYNNDRTSALRGLQVIPPTPCWSPVLVAINLPYQLQVHGNYGHHNLLAPTDPPPPLPFPSLSVGHTQFNLGQKDHSSIKGIPPLADILSSILLPSPYKLQKLAESTS